MYLLYIARAAEYFGATKTRDIFERGLQVLNNDMDIINLCYRHINLELKLDEIDRARALFVHATQFVDINVFSKLLFFFFFLFRVLIFLFFHFITLFFILEQHVLGSMETI